MDFFSKSSHKTMTQIISQLSNQERTRFSNFIQRKFLLSTDDVYNAPYSLNLIKQIQSYRIEKNALSLNPQQEQLLISLFKEFKEPVLTSRRSQLK